MERSLNLIFFIALLAVSLNGLTTSVDDQIQAKVDDFLKENGHHDLFTAIQLTYLPHGTDEGKSFFAGTVGHKDDTPIDEKTMVGWGSITKEFFTTLLINLEGEGKLDFDDTLGDIFPENFTESDDGESRWPQAWGRAKIHQMLNMTGGLPDHAYAIPLLILQGKFPGGLAAALKKPWTAYEIADAMAQYQREFPKECELLGLCFEPGTKYLYSTGSYMVATLIANKLTGKSTHDLFAEWVLPHGMPGEILYYADGELPDNISALMADSYTTGLGPNYPTNITNLGWYLDCSLLGSTNQLTHLIRSFYHGDVLGQAGTTQFRTKHFVFESSGVPIEDFQADCSHSLCYGMGVYARVDAKYGTKFYYPGAPLGFRTEYVHLPCSDFTIAVTLNSAPLIGKKASERSLAGEIIDMLSAANPDMFAQVGTAADCPAATPAADEGIDMFLGTLFADH